MTNIAKPILTPDQLQNFLAREFPQVADLFRVDAVGPMTARVTLVPNDKHLRPGGTISGPTMFELADCGVYLAIIAHVGEEALAVTTNASINFVRKPSADLPLIAEVQLLKLGRRLAVGDVRICSGTDLVAQANLTYSRPPLT